MDSSPKSRAEGAEHTLQLIKEFVTQYEHNIAFKSVLRAIQWHEEYIYPEEI